MRSSGGTRIAAKLPIRRKTPPENGLERKALDENVAIE
jgi:hypothetical protein